MGLDDRDTTPSGLRPIDRLFRSAAAEHGPRVIAVLLSGCDGEGLLGLGAIEEARGVAVVQDPDAAALPALPQHPADPGRPQHIAHLEAIATRLATLVDD